MAHWGSQANTLPLSHTPGPSLVHCRLVHYLRITPLALDLLKESPCVAKADLERPCLLPQLLRY